MILIKGAQLVTMDPQLGDLARGDILVQDGVITAIGPDLPGDGAEIIDASTMIALPGIIDAHNCLWQTVLRGFVPNLWTGDYFTKLLPLRAKFRPEDNFNAGYIGGAEMLSYGATTVVDYCHNIRAPGYAEAAIAGVQESGIRQVFTYSFMAQHGDGFGSLDKKFDDAEHIYEDFHDPDTRTTIHFGISSVGAATLDTELAYARALGAPSCIHVNGALNITDLHARGLLGSDLLTIHGNLITNDELAMMAEAGMPICFTPSADIQGTPADIVRRALTRGVSVVFGCDVPCHVASDTIGQLRAMFNVQGYMDGAIERSFAIVAGRRPPMRPDMPLLKPRDLLRIATIETARVLGMADRIGSLTPGKRADILLVDRGPFGHSIHDDPCAHVLLQTTARDIHTVMVDGEALVRGGRLTRFDAARAQAMVADSRSVILA